MTEYIYLLQEREFINSNKDIYKIGKTKQENLKRFSNYPKGSKLLFQIICNDCSYYEKELLYLFKNKYELQTDIGNEYFKGNYKKMIKDIYEMINNDANNTNNTSDIDSIDDTIYFNITNDYDVSNDTNKTIDTYEKLIKFTDIKALTIINDETISGYLKLIRNNKASWYRFDNIDKLESLCKTLNIIDIDIKRITTEMIKIQK